MKQPACRLQGPAIVLFASLAATPAALAQASDGTQALAEKQASLAESCSTAVAAGGWASGWFHNDLRYRMMTLESVRQAKAGMLHSTYRPIDQVQRELDSFHRQLQQIEDQYRRQPTRGSLALDISCVRDYIDFLESANGAALALAQQDEAKQVAERQQAQEDTLKAARDAQRATLSQQAKEATEKLEEQRAAHQAALAAAHDAAEAAAAQQAKEAAEKRDEQRAADESARQEALAMQKRAAAALKAQEEDEAAGQEAARKLPSCDAAETETALRAEIFLHGATRVKSIDNVDNDKDSPFGGTASSPVRTCTADLTTPGGKLFARYSIRWVTSANGDILVGVMSAHY